MTQPLAAVDIGQSLQNAINAIITSVGRTGPKVLAFLAILLIGWIIAMIIQRIVDMVLRRVGFDRIAQRGMVGDALKRSKYDATGLVAKLVFYGIMLLVLTLAFNVFGPNPVSTMLQGVVAWLPKAVVAIIIVVVASAIARAVKDIVGAALGNLTYGNLLANLAAIGIMALGVIAALDQVGIATTVTQPVLIAVLATLGGVIVVGVGGGMIRPMEERWQRWLGTAEREAGMATGTSSGGREEPSMGPPRTRSGEEVRAGAKPEMSGVQPPMNR